MILNAIAGGLSKSLNDLVSLPPFPSILPVMPFITIQLLNHLEGHLYSRITLRSCQRDELLQAYAPDHALMLNF